MSAPVSPGDVLAGKYVVERVLGAGGMGVVVAARHLQLDERVAIKFLQPESLKQPNLVARFLREGRLSAKVRSDHVARVRDVGTLESGAPYLVLEFLDGTDLDELVRKSGPLPVEAAVEYILQACEAIAEAHSLGIIHRDLKPANLFLTTRPDGSPCVKLIDFGISKLAGGSGGELDLTKTAETRGSPLFMSPEQIMAQPNVDARSDIWALGVTLHNLLTGGHPFPATQITELCGKILQGTPVPLRAAQPSAPEALEAVILRCLQKAPEGRFSSVAELAAALTPFAPPHARISADRISRIMRAAGTSSDPAVNTAARMAVASAPTLPALHASSGERGPSTPPGSSTPPGPVDTGERSGTAASSWSSTGPSSSSRRRSRLLVAAAVVVAACGVGAVTAIALMRREPAETAQGADKPAAPALEPSREGAPLVMPAPPSPPSSSAPVVLPSPPSSSGPAALQAASGPAALPAAPGSVSAAKSPPLPGVTPVAPGSPKAPPPPPSPPAPPTAAPAAKPPPAPKTEKDLFDTSL